MNLGSINKVVIFFLTGSLILSTLGILFYVTERDQVRDFFFLVDTSGAQQASSDGTNGQGITPPPAEGQDGAVANDPADQMYMSRVTALLVWTVIGIPIVFFVGAVWCAFTHMVFGWLMMVCGSEIGSESSRPEKALAFLLAQGSALAQTDKLQLIFRERIQDHPLAKNLTEQERSSISFAEMLFFRHSSSDTIDSVKRHYATYLLCLVYMSTFLLLAGLGFWILQDWNANPPVQWAYGAVVFTVMYSLAFLAQHRHMYSYRVVYEQALCQLWEYENERKIAELKSGPGPTLVPKDPPTLDDPVPPAAAVEEPAPS